MDKKKVEKKDEESVKSRKKSGIRMRKKIRWSRGDKKRIIMSEHDGERVKERKKDKGKVDNEEVGSVKIRKKRNTNESGDTVEQRR